MVIDADGLNLIAANQISPDLQGNLVSRGPLMDTILTPHPLEAARLLGQSVEQIEDNRIGSACKLANDLQCTVILKGAGSVIAAPDGRWAIINSGNAALATGGTGDMLAGLVGALLAQRYPPWEAASMAAWLHGDAADRWSLMHPRLTGLQPGILIDHLIESINQI